MMRAMTTQRRMLLLLVESVVIIMTLGTGALAAEERLSVSVPVANVRSGPDTSYSIIWRVEQYYPVVVVKQADSWCLFRDFEGDEGWLHKSLLDKTPSVITRNDQCNVRSGPGTNFDVLFTVEKGVPFKVIKRDGHWIYVEHADGDRGWIHDSLLW
jgi:SH3-like domain-containing protein